MAKERQRVLRAAEMAFALQDAEVAEARSRAIRSLAAGTATGTSDIDETFGLDQPYRLVFVRCHFAGNAGTAAFSISVDSGSGSAYDTKLFTISQAGTDKDVFLRTGGTTAQEPAAWTFQAADKVRVQWTNPDSGNLTWGLEVGLALAS